VPRSTGFVHVANGFELRLDNGALRISFEDRAPRLLGLENMAVAGQVRLAGACTPHGTLCRSPHRACMPPCHCLPSAAIRALR
jgi:hypothetical protein